ncbi:MAG: hypothetical protein Q8L48_19600 [Archangium sp.]|nr:hypothetical protein [Archangium sp.]
MAGFLESASAAPFVTTRMYPPELSVALEALYDAFSRDRLRLSFYCSHCVSDDEVAEFKATPLRQRDWSQVEPLIWSAMFTFGDERDARHCLPRMVELSCRNASNRELVLRLLRRLPISPPERALVNACFAEDLMNQLRADELLEVLEPIAAYGLQPRAEELLRAAQVAPRWYARLACEFGQRHGVLTAQESVLVDWVLATAKVELLERAFFLATEPDDQQLFSSAVQVLEWF